MRRVFLGGSAPKMRCQIMQQHREQAPLFGGDPSRGQKNVTVGIIIAMRPDHLRQPSFVKAQCRGPRSMPDRTTAQHLTKHADQYPRGRILTGKRTAHPARLVNIQIG